jgi:aminoglycoside phosphotransferase (APT) family kinase protein
MSGDAHLDRSGRVRPGEELDADKLGAYLRDALDAPGAELTVEQFPGGHSNLTYMIRLGDRELVLRRPPFGSKVKSAHDMGREYRMLSKLAPVYGRVPRPLAHCEDESVLGCEFYVMERLRGVIIRKQPPPGVTFDEATTRALCASFVDTFAGLHAIDYDAIGLGDFGKPDGYVERQVSGWTKRYHGSQTDDVPQVDHVAKWLAEHLPESGPGTIIHNDFKFDNLVMDPDDVTRVIGILDWEMTTIGDPLMDLGTSLSYWVQADDPAPLQGMAFGPTAVPGMLTRRELVEAYGERTGRSMSNAMFYFAYGLFKTAVVVQQIYYRYRQGLTKDERFAALGMAMKMLVDRAALAIESESI